jgi:YaiO family outer membrane protein
MRNKLLFPIFLLLISNLFGQSNNPDSLFSEAKSLAEQNRYREAIVLVDNLYKKYPENKDYSSYLSALYLWNGSPGEAKEILLKNQAAESFNRDDLHLLIQIETNLKNWSEVIRLADVGAIRFPESKSRYNYQKALALNELNEDREALNLLDSIPKSAPDYKAADYLRTMILKKKKNIISAGYLLTTFDQAIFKPQQVGFMEYSRRFSASTHLLRINYGDMFGKKAIQIETDAYVPLKKQNYIFLNLGISEKNSIFPQFRGGLEFYHEQKHVSASLGARYLYFGKQNDPLLVTGHLGLISKNGWSVNYRPFISFLDNSKTLASHLVYFRKAFSNKESYIQLDLQYGNLPYFYLTSDVLSRLKAYRIGINTRFRIMHNWFLQPIFMYEREEYIPETYRDRYTFQLILSFRF